MKTNLIACMLAVAITTMAIPSTAQRKKNKNSAHRETSILKLYEGPELPVEQTVHLICKTSPRQYLYFIGIDELKINNQSLTTGPHEVLLLPGKHVIKVRFVSKGEIAIPIEPFDYFNFQAGRTYHIKFEYAPGNGGYIDNASTTQIRLWMEEQDRDSVLMEKNVNGFGKSIE